VAHREACSAPADPAHSSGRCQASARRSCHRRRLDLIEYYSRAFVFGTSRCHRHAVVTSVDGGADADFPIAVDTREVLPKDMMIKRIKE
jgi:hypothetical protein